MSEVAYRGVDSAVERVAIGEVTLDRAAHLVTVGGRRLSLALREYALLEVLMLNADHVLESAAILHMVWGDDFTGDPGTVAVHVLRLRKKLERKPGASRHLRTVRGLGYVFDSWPIPELT